LTGPEPLSLARAFVAACEDELNAPKPGNVHVFADGHGMEAQDFIDSAHAAAAPLTTAGIDVGSRIFAAIEATWARVGQNTNLGIVLLCAPIAHAALNYPKMDLAAGVRKTLAGLTRADAELAFRAITRANPGGLGEAPQHDVTQPARVSLLDAMRAAADRDRIAYQYVNGFADIFGLGETSLAASRREGREKAHCILSLYLRFLCAFPDSHIVRKFGEETAQLTMAEARVFSESLVGVTEPEKVYAEALRFDQSLKSRGLNPGTSADLTVATLFADYVSGRLANGYKNG
jgi:triphosphoribosyl-dephospho-CoA synthase